MASTLITLSGPALVRYAVDAGIEKDDLHPLNVAALIFLGLACLKPVVVRVADPARGPAGERFLHALRVASFDKLQALPLGFFERERAGVLVSRLTSDVQSLNELVREALVEIFGQRAADRADRRRAALAVAEARARSRSLRCRS